MFDIGLGEMILLAAIALIAIGPKQLPEVARTVGKVLNELKKAMGEVTSTVANAREETDKAIRKVTSDLTNDLADVTDSINQSVNGQNVNGQSADNVQVASNDGQLPAGTVPKRVYPSNIVVDPPPHPGSWIDDSASEPDSADPAGPSAAQPAAQSASSPAPEPEVIPRPVKPSAGDST